VRPRAEQRLFDEWTGPGIPKDCVLAFGLVSLMVVAAASFFGWVILSNHAMGQEPFQQDRHCRRRRRGC